ncbi:IGHE protein, partial [Cinclus mexicanus]|nr:IGHE protein [Cinclus mexicanus]
ARTPSVFPLLSCGDCKGQVSFGCFAAGFFPQPAFITWEGVASGESLSFPEVAMAKSQFGLSSRVIMDAEKAKNGKFVCQVQHRSSNLKEEIK